MLCAVLKKIELGVPFILLILIASSHKYLLYDIYKRGIVATQNNRNCYFATEVFHWTPQWNSRGRCCWEISVLAFLSRCRRRDFHPFLWKHKHQSAQDGMLQTLVSQSCDFSYLCGSDLSFHVAELHGSDCSVCISRPKISQLAKYRG